MAPIDTSPASRPAARLIAILSALATLVLVACSPRGAPVGTGDPPPPVPAVAKEGAAPGAAIDFADVVRRIGLRFRPEGDGFRGGQPAYEARVRAGETRFTPRVPSRAGRVARRGEDLVLGAAVVSRAGVVKGGGAVVHERDHRLEIDRGLAVERLENTAEGLEQSFRFAERPRGSGAITVRVPVSGQRYAGATAKGLHFSGEGGLGVRYGAALWIDARGARTPIAVAHREGAIVLTVPAALAESSAYPAVLDPTIGPEIGVDDPIYAAAQGDQTVEAISYGNGQHLVAYNDGSLWVSRVSAAGVVLDPYGILVCATPSTGWRQTALAFDGTSWLIAWIDNRTGALDLYGARISGAGAVLDPNGTRLITATSFNGRVYHSLSYGGGGYVLAYVEQGIPRAQMVSTAAQPVGVPFTLTSGGVTSVTATAAAFNGTNHLVAFAGLDGTSPAIMARRVSPSGFTVGVVLYPTDSGAVPPIALASNGADWLLSYRSSVDEIRVSRVTAAGATPDAITDGVMITPLVTDHARASMLWDGSAYQVYWDSGFDISAARVSTTPAVLASASAIIGEAGDAAAPVVSFDPVNSHTLCAFTDDRLAGTFNGGDGRFTRVSTALAQIDNPSVLLTKGANHETFADVAWNGSSWLVVWLDTRGDDLDVYGARLDATGAMLDPTGIAITTAAGDQNRPVVGSNGSGWLVAWEDGTDNIVASRVSGAGAVLDATPLLLGAGVAPKVAGGGSDYAVVWHDYTTTYMTYARRVSGAGAFLDATPLVVQSGAHWPAVAWNGASWLVPFTLNGSVRARILSAAGVVDPTSIAITFSPPSGGDVTATAMGGQWLLAWNQSTDVRAIRISAAGAKVDASSFIVASATNEQSKPRAANDGTSYWITWQDTRNGSNNDDVYAARVSAAGVVLDPSGIVVANATYDEVAPSIAGGPAGTLLLVYHHLDASPSTDAVRVHGRLITTAAGPGTSCTLGSECTSGFCVDGVCCDSACTGACQACSAAKKGGGTSGVCAAITAGADPDNECAAQATTTCGTSGACNGSGACQLHPAGTSCGADVCSGTQVTPKICDGAGSCVSGAGSDCAPYACASGACKNPCAGDGDCTAGNVCLGGACLPPQSNGATCAAASQCASGFCVDGVCCNAACTGLCQACTTAKKGGGANGTCGAIGAGSDPDNECAAQAQSTCGTSGSCDGSGACGLWPSGTSCGAATCQGSVVKAQECSGAGTCGLAAGGTDCAPFACSAGACKTSCATAADCASGNVCVGGTCVAPQANGATCAAAAECASGFCIDSVCCNAACGGLCQACTTAKKGGGANGTCGAIGAGSDPDNECATQATSTCGTTGTCDGAGACSLHPAGLSCGADVCVGNLATPKICNGSGACVNGTGAACAPYTCSLGACKNPCTTSSHCLSGNVCVSGVCMPPQSNGATCTAASQCASGFCVDSVCCDAACTGTCQACTIAKKGGGANGACGAIGAGTDPDSECAQQAQSTCGTNGSCDGSGACQRWAAGTSCGSSICQGNVVSGQICDGSGACTAPPGGQDCAPFVCAGGACKNPCATTADCVSGHFCNAGACQILGDPGSPCATTAQCKSGFCADGVCCDAACTGTCQACSAAAKGQGLDGACGPVAAGGDPHDSCASAAPSTCGNDGLCDGNGACALFASGTVCTPASCASAVETAEAHCNGQGTCVAGAATPCDAAYGCAGTACATTCTDDSACAAGYHCVGGSCVLDASDAGAGGAGGVGGTGGTTTTTTSSSTTTTTTSTGSGGAGGQGTGGAGGQGTGGAAGHGGAPGHGGDAGVGGGGSVEADGSCGCRAVGATEDTAPVGVAALVALMVGSRRRRRSREERTR